MSTAHLMEILGERKGARDRSGTLLGLLEWGERGVSKAALLKLASFLGLSVSEIARLLPVTDRTIQRYGRNRHFNRVVSEHILEIARVAERGVSVFEEKQRFLAWMQRPSVSLGDRVPLDLLSSRFGIDLVLDELGRMEHGVVS